MVVINMQNPNALIAMAQVSQNADNPYAIFCEFIKYCIFQKEQNNIMVKDVITEINKEFGIYMPYNVIIECLKILEKSNIVNLHLQRGLINKSGTYDISEFQTARNHYRTIENELINSLIEYAKKYNKIWNKDFARELLIEVLDCNGIANEIFLYGRVNNDDNKVLPNENKIDEIFISDGDALENEDSSDKILYDNKQFVGKFIEEIINDNSLQKEYLLEVCEGLMVCIGTYQIPSNGSNIKPQIKGTEFFFDTRLLLRVIDCGNKAAVAASKELVTMIQDAGGIICYYPQTLKEMEGAFDKAIISLLQKKPPIDNEMRLFASQIKPSAVLTVLEAKKSKLQSELADLNIYLRENETFSDTDRIKFGFDYDDFHMFMSNTLGWGEPTISNDTLSIWETHMRRNGNYNDYYGTKERLPIFVTTNNALIYTSLNYINSKPFYKNIANWKSNRLPVITDVRLTCRLWNPSSQAKRISLLYLTANAVAAQRPTKLYLNTLRQIAIEIQKNNIEYSTIYLPSFFDDKITNAILDKINGKEDDLNIENVVGCLDELINLQLEEKAEVIQKITNEKESVKEKFDNQTQLIINQAIVANKNKLGFLRLKLLLIYYIPFTLGLILTVISSVVGLLIKNLSPFFSILLSAVIFFVDYIVTDHSIRNKLLKCCFPTLSQKFEEKISKKLKPSEIPYKKIIIEQVEEKTPLWKKCKKVI